MRPKLFNTAAAVSLLLCAVALLSWRASYHSLFFINWYGGTASWDLSISRGEMKVERVEWAGPTRPELLGWTWGTLASHSLIQQPIPQYRWHVHFSIIGFAAISFGFRIINSGFRLVWPCWAVVLLTAALPARWIIGRRPKRTSDYSCKTCGYNLTENISGLCPECATPVAKNSEVTT